MLTPGSPRGRSAACRPTAAAGRWRWAAVLLVHRDGRGRRGCRRGDVQAVEQRRRPAVPRPTPRPASRRGRRPRLPAGQDPDEDDVDDHEADGGDDRQPVEVLLDHRPSPACAPPPPPNMSDRPPPWPRCSRMNSTSTRGEQHVQRDQERDHGRFHCDVAEVRRGYQPAPAARVGSPHTSTASRSAARRPCSTTRCARQRTSMRRSGGASARGRSASGGAPAAASQVR